MVQKGHLYTVRKNWWEDVAQIHRDIKTEYSIRWQVKREIGERENFPRKHTFLVALNNMYFTRNVLDLFLICFGPFNIC